jgi:hypothetical protein
MVILQQLSIGHEPVAQLVRRRRSLPRGQHPEEALQYGIPIPLFIAILEVSL